jgi:hypothetical protein
VGVAGSARCWSPGGSSPRRSWTRPCGSSARTRAVAGGWGEVICALGLADEVQIARALSDQLGLPFLDLGSLPMGVEPFLITSSLTLVVGQRLARVPCSRCSEPVEADPRTLELLGLDPDQIDAGGLRSGPGCGFCAQTGYQGRVGLFEVVRVTRKVRELIWPGRPRPPSRRRRWPAACATCALTA